MSFPSARGRRVANYEALAAPGDFYVTTEENGPGRRRFYIVVWLPGQPEPLGALPIWYGPNAPKPCWEWNGDFDLPTLSPSISTKKVKEYTADGKPVEVETWHGHIKAGNFEGC